MVAAYLVGTRGTRAARRRARRDRDRHPHDRASSRSGVVTLALSQYVLPEDLYPWLNLVVGAAGRGGRAGVLRTIRGAGAHCARHHHHHDHARTITTSTTPAALVEGAASAMGAAAGLIPCPSALVVLLGAIAQHQVGARAGADRRLQPRAGGDADRARARRSSTRRRLARVHFSGPARRRSARRLGAADRRRRLRAHRPGDAERLKTRRLRGRRERLAPTAPRLRGLRPRP